MTVNCCVTTTFFIPLVTLIFAMYSVSQVYLTYKITRYLFLRSYRGT